MWEREEHGRSDGRRRWGFEKLIRKDFGCKIAMEREGRRIDWLDRAEEFVEKRRRRVEEEEYLWRERTREEGERGRQIRFNRRKLERLRNDSRLTGGKY